MAFDRNPSIQSFNFGADVVEYLLRGDAPITMLIVCSTRDVFLQQICASSSIAPTEPGNEHPEDAEECNLNRRFHNTIGLIAQSKRITLAFCPSLQHFCSYISAFRRRRLMPLKQEDGDLQREGGPLLAVLGLVALHYDTREFSAQGIAKTLALTVEIAARERVNLALWECLVVGREYASGGSLWEADVPLLSGQARGSMGGDNSHAGRTVKLKKVAKRWFYFV
ncbi:hypothetical protein AJ78_06197 [Emergomyces pasteurianus Ep9510]|uniref:Uncharacterized protein n=1 Tax=Emergomyces pasteurianus Ep9510 TaxID=1447872 RepID=A0A1J9PZL8_9EURO|nr:hypothetical protein AJ78_06197 [Emergomyces pasteurianus Ep9510]